jgi:hypothetical protein
MTTSSLAPGTLPTIQFPAKFQLPFPDVQRKGPYIFVLAVF